MRVAIEAIAYAEKLYVGRTAVMGGDQAVSIPELPALLMEASRALWATGEAVVKLSLNDVDYYLRVLPTKLVLEGGAGRWVKHHFLEVEHSTGEALVVGREAGRRVHAWTTEHFAQVEVVYNTLGAMHVWRGLLAAVAAPGMPVEVKAWGVDYATMRALLPDADARLVAWCVQVGERKAHFALAPMAWCGTVLRYRNHWGAQAVACLFGERKHGAKVTHGEVIIDGVRTPTTTETIATLEVSTLPLSVANAMVAEAVARSAWVEDVATGCALRYTEGTLDRSEAVGAMNSPKLSFTHLRGVPGGARRGRFASVWGGVYD